jgi:predicted small secreted protein
MPSLRRRLFLATLAATALGLAACENTIRGAGEDVRETGQAVEDAVEG